MSTPPYTVAMVLKGKRIDALYQDVTVSASPNLLDSPSSLKFSMSGQGDNVSILWVAKTRPIADAGMSFGYDMSSNETGFSSITYFTYEA